MGYKVSLITPVYNAAQYLDETIESVKNQTIGFENIEYLLVDDCSTDSSPQIIQKWASRYPNIKPLKTPQNSGTPAAPRNLALDNATAPFVMFLDNDDLLCPDACETLYREITTSDADLVSGDVVLMNAKSFSPEERKSLIYGTQHVAEGHYTIHQAHTDWLKPFLNNHWAKIYKRDLIERYHIRSLKNELWEDILFLLQYDLVSETFVYVKRPIINYRVRRESLSHVFDKQFYCSLPKSINYGMDFAIANGEAELYVELLNYGFSVIEYYIDKLLDEESLQDEELKSCLLAWKEPLVYSPKYKEDVFHSAYCKILSDDFASNEDEKAVFHFRVLKELYKQRQKELANIYSSTSFRLAKKISDLMSKGWKRLREK